MKGFKGGKGYDLFTYKCKIMLLEHGIVVVPVFNTNNRLTKIYEEATGDVAERKSKRRVRISNDRSGYKRRSDIGSGRPRRR